MTGLLDEIVAAARERAAALPAVPARRTTRAAPPSFAAALRGRERLRAIAEFKRRSPSAGPLPRTDSLLETVRRYQAAGAAAVSVLTEPRWFGGSLDDVAAAAAATSLPVLCKDFVVAPAQVLAAAAAGASAILLIVRCLPGGQLAELVAASAAEGLTPLLECHREAEVERALAFPAAVIGINNRDLDTLAVDLGTARRLLPRVPAERIAVAESGYETAEQLRELYLRCNAVLIGTALLRARDPRDLLGQLPGESR